MSATIDITEQCFGRLVVIERVFPNTPAKQARWRCRCDCGKETTTITHSLKSGKTCSCGCLGSEKTIARNKKGTIDLKGQRFGGWLVIERAEISKGKGSRWKCICDCGNIKIVNGFYLRKGISTSCGCMRQENRKKNWKGSGLTRTRLGNIHYHMMRRCYDPNCKSFEDYGNRRIKVCEEWHDLKTFYMWAISNGYSDNLTIERIDNNLGYYPENCTWIPKADQSKNRRNNHWMTLKGETRPMEEWSRLLGIPRSTIEWRLRNGRTEEQALATSRSKGSLNK